LRWHGKAPKSDLETFVARLLLLLRFHIHERDKRLAAEGFFSVSGVSDKHANADQNLVERDRHICPADGLAAKKLERSVGKNLLIALFKL
jgi:hypothetical protein